MIRFEFMPRCYFTVVGAVDVDVDVGGDGNGAVVFAAVVVGSTSLVLVLVLLFSNLSFPFFLAWDDSGQLFIILSINAFI